MIAAKDPQEFVPSGRQQLQQHPGPLERYDAKEGDEAMQSDFLLNELEGVSINDKEEDEWWIVRKSPSVLQSKDDLTLVEDITVDKKQLLYINNPSSPSWKEYKKRLSTLQNITARERLSEHDLIGDPIKSTFNKNKPYLKCKSIGIMEEELYVKDNVVIWSRGLVSTGHAKRVDNSRVTVCSYASQYPVKCAHWCTFYCERPMFDSTNSETINKPDKPLGNPLPSVCIIDSQNMKVFTVDNEDFITTLPFPVEAIWNTKFGILLEKENKRNKTDEETSPLIFSMAHPLDEVCPVAIRQGSIRIIDDIALKIVFTSENPSICMLFDVLTGQHSVYRIRRVKHDEYLEMAGKLTSPTTAFNLSNRLKNRLSLWDTHSSRNVQPTPSPFSSRIGSIGGAHSHSQPHSKSHSPMATISRCQSPTVSPLVGGTPWLPKSSRIHSSFRNASTNMSFGLNTTHFETTEQFHQINATICLDHMWTDSFVSHSESTGPASKVFLIDDLVGYWYLCYLIPIRSQLSIVRVDFRDGNYYNFGILTSISAKDAVPIPHLHMLAILEHNGNVVLYSGLTMVGKLHISGVLVKHAPSPKVLSTLPQFNSPFPRRSTLLPHHETPVADPHFEGHLISPVQPVSSRNSKSSNSYTNNVQDLSKSQLKGLIDAVEDRLTLQYVDGTYYRISLPSLASNSLVEGCLNALRQTLQNDAAMTLLTRWYAVRNAPGPHNLGFTQEWNMFTSLVYGLIGYEVDQSSEPVPEPPITPSNLAKRQRQSQLGTDADWNALLKTNHHKDTYTSLSQILHLRENPLKTINKQTQAIININSVLFTFIRIIHYSLHLLYEEIKLNLVRSEELPYLAKFLSKLSFDLALSNFVVYYWKDFPEKCSMYDPSYVSISPNILKNVVHWTVMNHTPENIIEHIYNLLKDVDVSPYPYIPNINTRSKAIVELCGIFIKGKKAPSVPIAMNSFIKCAMPSNNDISSTSKSEFVDMLPNVSAKVVYLMTQMGITSRDLDSYPAGINLLLHDALWQCREISPPNWGVSAYRLLQRPDLAAQAELVEKSKSVTSLKNPVVAYDSPNSPDGLPTIKQVDDLEQEDGMEDVDSALLKLRFPDDHRIAEVRRLLQSSKPVPITLVQHPDVSDHDFIEEQEKQLYAVCARTMALPLARGMFTLRTATPVVTEPLPLPKLCMTGKAPPRGVTVELSHIDYPQNMQHWPIFHNGVANGLKISPDAHNIDSTWIIFNKPKSTSETNMEHAGFLMALGLNGHLKNLTVLSTYDYLSKLNEMTSVGILLGLSSAMRGTANTNVTKMLSIHVEALLPPTSMELDVPQNVQIAALLGVGLVYEGTAHRHMTEVLLSEIGRPPGPEMENSVDRESYSLSAGLALGLVNLRQGGRPSGLSDLNVADMLHYYMSGGNKRPLMGAQTDKYKVASFQIREGTTVNLDVTAPGATIALGLMYLGSGNKALAEWMAPPGTQYLLDFVRPDILMLRVLSRGLIMWDTVGSSLDWIESQVPETIRPFCMVKPTSVNYDIDYEAMNQAYCNIVAGACFVMGLKYAGSADEDAFRTLLHYCKMFTSLTGKSIAELAGKPTIETCLNVVLLSASLVVAGTGNLELMRIIRHLRRRVGLTSIAVVTYGSHMALHMALGFLFLGGGRYTLSNSPSSVAALICALYPKFPTHSNDNRYHLQAFRHLYVLAVEPRLVIPKDVITGRMCYARLRIVYLDGSESYRRAPCLIPDLNALSKVVVEDPRYWPVTFERGRNWDHLLGLLKSYGYIEVKQRAGCLSYVEDKFGYRSELARTLTHSRAVPWDPPPKAITSFSSDCTVRHFTDNFLTNDSGTSTSVEEQHILKLLTNASYDCVIKDKEDVLPIFITLMKVVEDLNKPTSSMAQLWQFKLACALVLDNGYCTQLFSPETILALHQSAVSNINTSEKEIKNALQAYFLGKTFICDLLIQKKLANYITFYDLPFNISSLFEEHKSISSHTFYEILHILSEQKYSVKAIDKIALTFNISL